MAEAPMADEEISSEQQSQEVEQSVESGQEPQLSPRELQLQRIYERHNHEGIDSVEPVEEAEEETPAPVMEEAPAEEPPSPRIPEQIEYVDGVAHMRLKVNGEVVLRPLDQVLASVQKNESADLRMQQSAAYEQRLKEREEELAAREAALQQSSLPAQPDGDDQALANNIVKELVEGDETKAAEMLAQALSRKGTASVAPVLDEQAIVEKAVAATRQETMKSEIEKGWAAFQSEFEDIVSDPNLVNIADGFTEVVQQEHPDWSPTEIMRESGNRTRDWLAKTAGAEREPTPSVSTVDRQQRKDGLVPMPPAHSAALEQEGEPPPPTNSDILREMRAGRGLPT